MKLNSSSDGVIECIDDDALHSFMNVLCVFVLFVCLALFSFLFPLYNLIKENSKTFIFYRLFFSFKMLK